MKILNRLILLFIGISFILSGYSIINSYQINENELIKGVWISTEDPNWKIEFNKGKCYWYFIDKPNETFNYTISITSPQCGNNVPTGSKFSYLKLVNTLSISDVYCYEINTLTNKFLTLMYVGGVNTKLMIFKKQIITDPTDKYDNNN